MSGIRWIWLAALPLIILSGCAAKIVPPVLQLNGKSCAAVPDLRNAAALPIPSENGAQQSVKLDATGTCFSDQNGSALYTVFSLPATPAILDVRATALGTVILAPRLLLLDDKGQIQRDIGASEFKFRGGALSGLVRLHDGEHYLVLASDPRIAGQTTDRIALNVQTTQLSPGFNVFTGSDATTTYTFSLAGPATVTLSTVPAGPAH